MSSALEKFLAKDRLDSYRGATNNKTEHKILRYNYNISLSKEMYPLLHFFEVVLRNSLHLSWQKVLNDQAWLLNKNGVLLKNEIELIDKVIHKLKNRGGHVSEGKIISNSNFELWGNFYNSVYQKTHFASLKIQFPNATNKERSLAEIRKMVGEIRDLRNRVFHHEPIWKRNDLGLIIDNMKRMISWVDTTLTLESFNKSEAIIRSELERQDTLLK